jgi:hypothetical protein
MIPIDPRKGNDRVILHGIGENTEEEKSRFCEAVAKNYGIPLDLMKKIVDRCPIVVKKDLPFKKAELLAFAFKSSGGSVSVERKRNPAPISLELIPGEASRLELRSANLRKSPGGVWQVFGRVRNVSKEELRDVWPLVQLFDEFEELVAFEETPLPINPLRPGASSPFKAMFEGDLPVHRMIIAFKDASGHFIPARDGRDKREWVEIKRYEAEKKEPFLRASSQPEETFSLNLLEDAGELGKPLAAEEKFEIGQEERAGPEDLRGLIEMEEGSPEEEVLHPGKPLETMAEDIRQTEPYLFLSNEKPHATDERPGTIAPEEKKEATLYPWLEEFRKTIVAYGQRYRDPFVIWLESVQKEGEVREAYDTLFILLVYARFDQKHPSKAALENTKKVFKLSLGENLLLEEIPPLEGALFFSGDTWRDLYFRALPKLREVSGRIFEKNEWEPSELDRLIRIIPHMTDKNSRRVIRFIHERISEIRVNVLNMDLGIDESLYRVASRLGIVNPLFDYYRGKNSMGDLKVQSFAKAAFPDDPGTIEEPMSRLGGGGEGAHCFPIDPQCRHCPFENFCPKLFPGMDPAEKGMIIPS